MNLGLGACTYVPDGPTGDGNSMGNRQAGLTHYGTFVFFDEAPLSPTLSQAARSIDYEDMIARRLETGNEPQWPALPWFKHELNLFQLFVFF